MGSSCFAQQVAKEQDHEQLKEHLRNKMKIKNGLVSNQSKQEDDEKHTDEKESPIENPLIEESVVAPDAKSHKPQHTQKSHQTNKKGLFSKQVSQFVKCEDD